KRGRELDAAIAEVRSQLVDETEPLSPPAPRIVTRAEPRRAALGPPTYAMGEKVATREAFGTALAPLGVVDDRVVVLDADVGNSTFSETFEKQAPDRFYECYIAEQV